MIANSHYLLFSEASCTSSGQTWRFVLQNVETSRRMVVADEENVTCGERLELLAVVRGLEALDGPAQVTLVTKSRYVSRGIRSGLTEWRANDWQWERFGRIVPVKDHDLWQRVDRALLFHKVVCQAWQFEDAATEEPLSCVDPQTHVLEAVEVRCHELTPNSCELPATTSEAAETAAIPPIKRRVRPPQRVRRRRVQREQRPNSLGRVAASLVSKATNFGESLRAIGAAMPGLTQGAA